MNNKHDVKYWHNLSGLNGNSQDYLEYQYEQYLLDKNLVDTEWQDYFSNMVKEPSQHPEYLHSQIRKEFENFPLHTINIMQAGGEVGNLAKQVEVDEIVYAYRSFGHRYAKTDPLELTKPEKLLELELAYYGLNANDLTTEFYSDGLFDHSQRPLAEIMAVLQQTYCGFIGAEFYHIDNREEREWLQKRIESERASPQYSAAVKKRILDRLIAAETLETYLGNKYVGQKRFSLEGVDSLMVALDKLLSQAGKHQIKEIIYGMAHRGRLNVMVNLLGMPTKELYAEFEGKNIRDMSGDVKYHLGLSADVRTADGDIHLALAFNPSHLEFVSPVVEGAVRSRQDRYDDQERKLILPVLIHGDAAFAGQGIVMETINMSQTAGYKTGGTVHIVINNQVGFTTNVRDSRSTVYCTDIAKMIDAPVFHVNADEPEAVLFVAELALDYRMQFGKDVVIDLIGYRRHGHNEADEPAVTQPLMYQVIRNRPTVRALYQAKLEAEGVITAAEAEQNIAKYRQALDQGERLVDNWIAVDQAKIDPKLLADWTPYYGKTWQTPANTGYPKAELKALAKKMLELPAGFTLQPQVQKTMENRMLMTEEKLAIDWGYAENLAYASLLKQGYPIRFSGQDCRRGTFVHRHASVHDAANGNSYTPLAHLFPGQPKFQIFDSLLSEAGVLAFEYGYSTSDPNSLVMWEAQFGDFVNGAQVIIDQFISSAEQKWGRLCGLTMLLPHGYEGMGPEHTSARLERFLQLCAQLNIQVCVPTTPAQIFHLLRRQMLRPYRKPLIVLTPKSLLRHPLAVSSYDELSQGEFRAVIAEVDKLASQIRRVVLCSGKVYYDLLALRRKQNIDDVALIRIEQLYPFPSEELQKLLQGYRKVEDIVWCQEEPMNQGAWYCSRHNFIECLSDKQKLSYVGRPSSAAPAVGYHSVHVKEQEKLLNEALGSKS